MHNQKLKVLSWNVRGLNDKKKRVTIRQMVLKKKNLHTVFSGNKMEHDKLINNQRNTGFKTWSIHNDWGKGDSRRGVDSLEGGYIRKIGRTERELLYISPIEVASRWNMSDYHGYIWCKQANKQAFLEELKKSKIGCNCPWILCGDFNVTLNSGERSNVMYDLRGSNEFRHVIHSLNLIDLHLAGRKFVWSNDRHLPSFARLDRVLISTEWQHKYPNTK